MVTVILPPKYTKGNNRFGRNTEKWIIETFE